ncbi:hypothetical protein MXB_5668 [Myxobolus squamalis]|nr:hypothetical protein MXB_5668 [Myxobolus squamalis]
MINIPIFCLKKLFNGNFHKRNCVSKSISRQPHLWNIDSRLADIKNSILDNFNEFDDPIRSACLHYFGAKGKYTRPKIVLHVSQIMNYYMGNT